MQIPNDNLANLALILFEKGILSSSTLATEFGIDYKKEQELMKFENDIKTSLEKAKKTCGCENKQELIQLVEQARRNVEVLTKCMPTIRETIGETKETLDAYNESLQLLRKLTAKLDN